MKLIINLIHPSCAVCLLSVLLSLSSSHAEAKQAQTLQQYGLEGNSSISGQCFDDTNRNNVKDPGEIGIAGLPIILTATINGDYFERTLLTDSVGDYEADSLSAGTYTVSATLRPHWIQTWPPYFKPIIITLDTGMQWTDADFGFTFVSTFNLGFRSFIPESIALARNTMGHYGQPVLKHYITQEIFNAGFQNNSTRRLTASSLQIKFSYALDDSLIVSPPAVQTYNPQTKSIVLDFPDSVPLGGKVTIQGLFTPFNPLHGKPSASIKTQHCNAKWANPTYNWPAPSNGYSAPWQYVNPNAVDALVAMAPYRILIGLPRNQFGTHTVYLKKWKDMAASLVRSNGIMHTGPPRCLCGTGTQRQLSKMPPFGKGTNMLFAEAVALKVNIQESALNITPLGFGDLIFDEGGDNPLNGKSIQSIADVLDDYMSSWAAFGHCQIPNGYVQLDSMRLYQTIHKIDSAFCGPIEYSSWYPGSSLTLLPVRSVLDIPFLHIDSTNPGRTKQQVVPKAAPERFKLSQNYPNPFNPTTTISFSLPQEARVTLKIYNVLGQEVATLLNREDIGEGDQEINFDASHLSSGIYFYRISVEGIADENGGTGQSYTAVKKMLLVK